MSFIIFGIKVEITFLFVALVAFIISLKAPSNVFITILSSLLHELGHLLMMLTIGNKPEKVRFEITGINIIRNNTNISTKSEILIALGGPLVNAFLFIICCLILCLYNTEMISTFACVNLILMTFNILPIKRLDGGIALYYLLSQKYQMPFCSNCIKITSIIFIILIYIWGIYVFIASNYNISLIIIAIFLTLSLFGNNEC